MDESLQTYNIADIRRLYPRVDEYALGDDFLLCEVSGGRPGESRSILKPLKYPVRFDGYACMFCLKGDFRIDVNLRSYDIHPNSMFINLPGNIVRVTELSDGSMGEFDFIVILASREFMANIRFDFSQSFKDSIRIMEMPVITLTESQKEVGEDYLRLARKIIQSPLSHRREIIASLISSLTYTSVDVWCSNLPVEKSLPQEQSPRLTILFDRFIALVTEHHATHRNMAFYAEKLCLTPKYLSKLIKQASGRSAPEWIDSFVILEAKNMLKYSSVTIKEIVYKLHFPNQSVFYKFFKTHTGMTPSEYRHG